MKVKEHLLIYFISCKFFTLGQLVVFAKSLSNSKALQISRTILSILANLNSAVVWIVSILHLIFSHPSLSHLWRPFQEHQLQLVSLLLQMVVAMMSLPGKRFLFEIRFLQEFVLLMTVSLSNFLIFSPFTPVVIITNTSFYDFFLKRF